MQNQENDNGVERFEKALEDAKKARFVLRLYVAGNTPRSQAAIENIREICETQLEGRYTLDVIDIYQQPELARENQILAAPTLIKSLPLPLRRLIGNLSSIERIIVGLNLQTVQPKDADVDHEPE